MRVEARPLFRPDVLRRGMEETALPPPDVSALTKLGEWAALLSSPQAGTLTEQVLLRG